MTLREAVATGRKYRRRSWEDRMVFNIYPILCVEDAIADDWETEKVKREGWISVYTSSNSPSGREAGMIYATEEEAKRLRGALAITTTKITWEE